MVRGSKIKIPWLRKNRMITREPKSRKNINDHLLYHFRSECVRVCWGYRSRNMNNRQGSRQCSKTRGTSGGMISRTLLPFRLNGISRDDMTLFLAIVTELLGTIQSNMTKIFTTKALDNMHVLILILPLCYISHRNRCTNISPMFHGSLSYDRLLLT